MQAQSLDTDYIIRTTAKDAAKAAAQDFGKQNSPPYKDGNGLVALYTWGVLAFVSALYAGAAGMFPDLNIVSSQSTIVAQNIDIQETQQDIVMAVQEPLEPKHSMPVRTAAMLQKVQSLNADTTTTASINRQETVSIAPSLNLGANIGISTEVSELAIRYIAFNRRAPDIFASLQPRLKFSQDGETKRASLIAGPFSTKAELSTFCREVRLRLTADCASAEYSGEVFEVDFKN